MTLTLPFPPSLNRMYRVVHGRFLTSKVGREYKQTVGLTALAARVTPFQGPIGITVRLYRPAKRGDADNFLKVALDSMQGHCYNNDSQIIELHVYRNDDAANPRMEVEICQIPA